MPSAHRRVMLTVPPALEAVLVEYADALQKPVATAIVQILEGSVPQLTAVTRIQQAVNAGRLEEAAELSRKLFRDAVLPLAAAQGELEDLVADHRTSAGDVHTRRAKTETSAK